MRRPLTLFATATATAAAALLTGCGADGSIADDDVRTVEIDMVDTAFEPEALEVGAGETVRFVFTNTGQVAHDAFIGDETAQDDHEAEMREQDDDADGHDGGHGDEDEDAVTVEPGSTGELTYTFERAGSLEIGCHQPGHYEEGMKIAVEVV